jgi:bifunctional non-homologous end joining protein LigD
MTATAAQVKQAQADRITLYYRQGASDKVYQASVEPAGDLFIVNFAFGRRGSTLQTGTKTEKPVYYEYAKRIYDKLVNEKMSKGYTPGPNGAPYQHTSKEQHVTGIVPQLLNPIDETEASALIADPVWCMQEKKDGKRLLIWKDGATVIGINRLGLAVGIPSCIIKNAQEIAGDFLMDGECVGETLYVFDLLSQNGGSIMAHPYQSRLHTLTDLLDYSWHPAIDLIETAMESADKVALLQTLRNEQREGIVFKRLDAPYTSGRPNSGGTQLKYKFCTTLSAVVAKVNDQRSVELKLRKENEWVTAGNVTIPPNHNVPGKGSVIEVRYLYAFPEGGCLYQPVYIGPRSDTTAWECTITQLKYKPEDAC